MSDSYEHPKFGTWWEPKDRAKTQDRFYHRHLPETPFLVLRVRGECQVWFLSADGWGDTWPLREFFEHFQPATPPAWVTEDQP